jgi:hypothetical protein
MRHVPIVPTWLLRHFGCSTQNNQIIGDLVEQYQRGCSRCWYWRQTLIALIEGFITEVRLHKLLMLQGVVVGILAQKALHYAIDWSDRILVQGRAWERPNALAIVILVIGLASATSTRLIAILQRPHHRALVFALIAWQFIPFVLPFRLFRFPIPHFLFTSWIGEFSLHIHIFLWNTNGMTALHDVCGTCSTLGRYGIVLFTSSAFLTIFTMLFGSGVLHNKTTLQVARRRAHLWNLKNHQA